MPNAEFFHQFGFYTVRNFLGREFCQSLIREMNNSESKMGGILPFGADEYVYDESFKSRLESEVSLQTIEKVSSKLLEKAPEIAKHYDVEIKNVQRIRFATYRTGDFYKAHVDYFTPENTPEAYKNKPVSPRVTTRKVAAIIFLNDESKEPLEGAYGGGNLTFHGLMKDSAFGNFGLPIIGECGLLVTFPPSVLHEVVPVTHGTRYSLATWYS